MFYLLLKDGTMGLNIIPSKVSVFQKSMNVSLYGKSIVSFVGLRKLGILRWSNYSDLPNVLQMKLYIYFKEGGRGILDNTENKNR